MAGGQHADVVVVQRVRGRAQHQRGIGRRQRQASPAPQACIARVQFSATPAAVAATVSNQLRRAASASFAGRPAPRAAAQKSQAVRKACWFHFIPQ
jgi:hypothetical protein